MRAIALIATYNERRFIAACIEHLADQGVDVYLIDNESTDDTVARASEYFGRGLVGLETLPRAGIYSLKSLLTRKEQVADELEADWFIVQDADEFRTAGRADATLVEALEEVDRAGFNAVEFTEFSFLPTAEAPEHDHPRFRETMRSYYAFIPRPTHHVKAFKKQSQAVGLVESGGHRAMFDGVRLWPEAFELRHYLFLSREHAGEKYLGRVKPAAEAERGWGGWRNTVAACTDPAAIGLLELPRRRELRTDCGDARLDESEPHTSHVWMEAWATRIKDRLPAAGADQRGV
jgi:glycosyltransferase involved in cell wall biosynthesis